MSEYKQLALPLRFDQSCSFENFYSGDEFLIHSIKSKISDGGEPLLLINGEHLSGKSHILNATALYCQQKKIRFQYFDAAMLLDYEPEMIANCDKGSVLLIDDVHLLARSPQWERRLYDLYNDAQRQQWLLIVSCLKAQLVAFQLPDWVSRLQAGLAISLYCANDEQLNKLIQFRSKILGLKIKPEVIDYLIKRYDRDIATQLKLLNQLNAIALEQQKNITIPFIKKVLEK